MSLFRKVTLPASFAVAAALSTMPLAMSGEKTGCRVICQPLATTCQPAVASATPTAPTCCQPLPTTVTASPSVELTAYARPAQPRRIEPQPDTLETSPTVAVTYCAIYLYVDYGSYQSYYGINCSTRQPLLMNGVNLPIPGDCNNPNGACITVGSNVTPTAANTSRVHGYNSFSQKGLKLPKPLKAGQEPRNSPNPQASKPGELKERTRIGQPIYVKFPRVAGANDYVIAELQRFAVKGIGPANREFSATLTAGHEVDAVPAGAVAKVIPRNQITVVDDHVARLEIGNAVYEIVTATKLVP